LEVQKLGLSIAWKKIHCEAYKIIIITREEEEENK